MDLLKGSLSLLLNIILFVGEYFYFVNQVFSQALMLYKILFRLLIKGTKIKSYEQLLLVSGMSDILIFTGI